MSAEASAEAETGVVRWSGELCELEFIVLNHMGLHVRPATSLASHAGRFSETEIWLSKGEQQVDAKTPLLILTLAGVSGTRYTLRAQGPDAEQALKELYDLAQRKFDVDGD